MNPEIKIYGIVFHQRDSGFGNGTYLYHCAKSTKKKFDEGMLYVKKYYTDSEYLVILTLYTSSTNGEMKHNSVAHYRKSNDTLEIDSVKLWEEFCKEAEA
jgi:hypothetical protein